MDSKSLVSVIIIFLNAAQFIEEAIDSVFAQTYDNWELLLVDDGSSDESTAIARRYAAHHPGRVRFLTHADRQNQGKAASRNLGIRTAAGEYVAFLDADDIWLPHKLERQVAILDAQPEAAMVYGPTQWWYSWTGKPEDRQRDFAYDLGVPPDTLVWPPTLFMRFFLRQEAAIPSPCSILVRREVIERIGGFEESFRGIYNVYEDQTFYAKICLKAPVFVSSECCDKYRQHANSSCSVSEKTGQEFAARRFFLNWLTRYLAEQGVKSPLIWQELQREIKQFRHPIIDRRLRHARALLDQMRGPLIQIARRTLPIPVRHWLWNRWQARKNPPVGSIRFGSLRRVEPVSRDWGFDRGLPIDRHYIERFLAAHTSDICGHVLEIADDTYTRLFGGDRLTRSDVLNVVAGHPKTTIVGDLACADHIPSDTFDCIIITQTLHLIYDVRAALKTLFRILKPGGVLLVTIPGISQISRYDMDRWGDYWRFTTRSAQRLFEEVFPAAHIQVAACGNVLAATALLYGLVTQELRADELDYCDPDYEILITIRAVKLTSPAPYPGRQEELIEFRPGDDRLSAFVTE